MASTWPSSATAIPLSSWLIEVVDDIVCTREQRSGGVGLGQPARTSDDRHAGQIGRRLLRSTWVDLMMPFASVVDPPTRAGARRRHPTGADQQRAQSAVRRLGVRHGHGPSVGVVRGSAGHRHVAADAHQRACGAEVEEMAHRKIGSQALSDATGIDDETMWERDRRALPGSMTMSSIVGPES